MGMGGRPLEGGEKNSIKNALKLLEQLAKLTGNNHWKTQAQWGREFLKQGKIRIDPFLLVGRRGQNNKGSDFFRGYYNYILLDPFYNFGTPTGKEDARQPWERLRDPGSPLGPDKYDFNGYFLQLFFTVAHEAGHAVCDDELTASTLSLELAADVNKHKDKLFPNLTRKQRDEAYTNTKASFILERKRTIEEEKKKKKSRWSIVPVFAGTSVSSSSGQRDLRLRRQGRTLHDVASWVPGMPNIVVVHPRGPATRTEALLQRVAERVTRFREVTGRFPQSTIRAQSRRQSRSRNSLSERGSAPISSSAARAEQRDADANAKHDTQVVEDFRVEGSTWRNYFGDKDGLSWRLNGKSFGRAPRKSDTDRVGRTAAVEVEDPFGGGREMADSRSDPAAQFAGGSFENGTASGEIDLTREIDQWGRRLVYRAPGKTNPLSFDLYSLGPTGEDHDGDSPNITFMHGQI